jgi:hypothetical protein
MNADLSRGELVVRSVLMRLTWLATLLAALPTILGYGQITPTRIVRLMITVGICVFVFRRAAPWAKWLLLPPVVGFIVGGGGAVLLLRPFSLWSVLFLAIGLLYAYYASRLLVRSRRQGVA